MGGSLLAFLYSALNSANGQIQRRVLESSRLIEILTTSQAGDLTGPIMVFAHRLSPNPDWVKFQQNVVNHERKSSIGTVESQEIADHHGTDGTYPCADFDFGRVCSRLL